MPSRWHAPDDDTIAWFQNNDSQTFTRRNIATDALEAAAVFAADIDARRPLLYLKPDSRPTRLELPLRVISGRSGRYHANVCFWVYSGHQTTRKLQSVI